MEFGTPSTRLSRRRKRGSRRSDDLTPSTPSNRFTTCGQPTPTGGGRTTPTGSRTPVMIRNKGGLTPGHNGCQTPGSHRPSICDVGTPHAREGGNYSGLVDCSVTPRSFLVGPSSTSHAPISYAPSPACGNTPKSCRGKGEGGASTKTPIKGRILKVFESLPFSQNFTLEEKIGEGTFSTVYLANRKNNDVKIALKHLVPTSKPSRILMEAGCMRAVSGHPNIIQLLGMWRVVGDVVLVMPYLKHARFSDLLFSMKLKEIKNYIGNLISALRHIHKLGIIHRDIKPSNFLYDREKRKYALVDFGLAQFQADLKPGAVETGRGKKRKPSDDLKQEPGARMKLEDDRSVLDNIQNKLSVSPTIRLLRDSRVVRRSPRKQGSPQVCETRDNMDESRLKGLDESKIRSLEESKLKSPVRRDQTPSGSPAFTPRKRLRLSTELANKCLEERTPVGGSLRVSPRKGLTSDVKSPRRRDVGTPDLISPTFRRESPRKHSSLTRPSGFSKLTITANSIVGSSGASTPSLSRTPSFTMLEPASYTASQTSQATDQTFGRTPMLRASVTSTCSSAPPPAIKKDNHQSKFQCRCSGKPQVCQECLAHTHMHAPRAGTPGFRPPEVLLKHPNQTTAIDLWAVGVIMISLLSRSYPFFRAPDDMTALAELTVIFGSKEMKMLAKQFGRSLTVSRESEPQDLDDLCKVLALRERKDTSHQGEEVKEDGEGVEVKKEGGALEHQVTKEGVDLVYKLLNIDHTLRLTAEEALNHTFLKEAEIN